MIAVINFTIIFVLAYFIWFTSAIHETDRLLQIAYRIEQMCDNSPMEMETVRYQMIKLMDKKNTLKNTIISISSIAIVLLLISLLVAVKLNVETVMTYDFMAIISSLIIVSVILIIFFTNNFTKNPKLIKYQTDQNRFIDKLETYFDQNKIKRLEDLPAPFLKSLIDRFRSYNEVAKITAVPLYSDNEILLVLKDFMEKKNGGLQVKEIFKYMKLFYDKKRPEMKTDIEVILKSSVPQLVKDTILPSKIGDKELTDILSLKETSNDKKQSKRLLKLKPYLQPEYRAAIQEKKDTAVAVPGKESEFNYVKKLFDKYEANTDVIAFSFLASKDYDPYKSLDKQLLNIKISVWFLWVIIAYVFFHTQYSLSENDTVRKNFLIYTALFLFIVLFGIVIFRMTDYN